MRNDATFDPRSSILDPRSSILDPRSSILDPRISCWLLLRIASPCSARRAENEVFYVLRRRKKWADKAEVDAQSHFWRERKNASKNGLNCRARRASVTKPLQSSGLALAIVGCQYSRAIASRVACLVEQTIAPRTTDGDGFEHFLSVCD